VTRGAQGERLAAEYLTAQGYEIVARNFRTRFGELDLIAQKDGFLALVEVKLRKNARHGAACEAVDLVKQNRLILAAEEWLSVHPTALQPRFDVIEVYLPDGADTPLLHHLENAFDA
jgi:putative endonuclease